jgi:hypothetical protein
LALVKSLSSDEEIISDPNVPVVEVPVISSSVDGDAVLIPRYPACERVSSVDPEDDAIVRGLTAARAAIVSIEEAVVVPILMFPLVSMLNIGDVDELNEINGDVCEVDDAITDRSDPGVEEPIPTLPLARMEKL